MSGHHITPSATKGWGEASEHFRPRSEGEAPSVAPAPEDVTALAFELADETARSDIECYSVGVEIGGQYWNDMDQPGAGVSGQVDEEDRAWLARAVRYLELRGDNTSAFRMVRHPVYPHLVRFEVKP